MFRDCVNQLYRLLICASLLWCGASIHAMVSESRQYLPPVNETAMQEVRTLIDKAPDTIVDLFKSSADIDSLARDACLLRTKDPKSSFVNYLHAACLATMCQGFRQSQSNSFFDSACLIVNSELQNEPYLDYYYAAVKSGCDKALLWLGELYCQHREYGKAEAAWRIHNSPLSLRLLGQMCEKELKHEFKARAYYLAAGKELVNRQEFADAAQAYSAFADMSAHHILSLQKRGSTDAVAFNRYVEEAIDGYLLSGLFGNEASMRSVVGLADYAERELKVTVPSQKRMTAYAVLLNQQFPLVNICDSYQRFMSSCAESHADPLPANMVTVLSEKLDTNTHFLAYVLESLRKNAAAGDVQSHYELAERIYWNMDPAPSSMVNAVKLYTSVLLNAADELPRTIIERLKSIVQDTHYLKAQVELLFWVLLSKYPTRWLEEFFGSNLADPEKYSGSIIEYVAINEYERLQNLMQGGNPLAMYIGAIICYHQAQQLPEMGDEQRTKLWHVLRLLQKAYEGDAFIAWQLYMEVSGRLAKFYRYAGDYERAFSLLTPFLRGPAGTAALSLDFLREYALLCIAAPHFINPAFYNTLRKQFSQKRDAVDKQHGSAAGDIDTGESIINDFRAKICATYLELANERDFELRIKQVYSFVQSILQNSEQRDYFFHHCPDFVRQALCKASEARNSQACYLYCLLLFLNDLSDDRAYEFVTACEDQNDPWVKCMRAAFVEKYARHELNDEELLCIYCEFLASPQSVLKEFAFSALKRLAERGSIPACCELFLAACEKNDIQTSNLMFSLMKKNKVNQREAITYLSEHCFEKLSQVANNDTNARYLVGLVQWKRAEQLPEKNAEWCLLARSSFDSFVRSYESKCPCAENIAFIGRYLINYYRQAGDSVQSSRVAATIYQDCNLELLSSVLTGDAPGTIAICCELFLIAGEKKDMQTSNLMFSLMKQNEGSQREAITYLSEYCFEKLSQVAINDTGASYLFGLVQLQNANKCEVKNAEWCSLARSAFDNFVRSHKSDYPCPNKIALLGCYLVGYYQQAGDTVQFSQIKEIMYELCDPELLVGALINCLNDKTLSAETAATLTAMLDEQAVKKNVRALDFLGQAYCEGRTLPSGHSIAIDPEKALMRLNSLLEISPGHPQACYLVGKLLIKLCDMSDETVYNRACRLLRNAAQKGNKDADRLLLIQQLRKGKISDKEFNEYFARLKKYADAGDPEAASLLADKQKDQDKNECRRLRQIVQTKKSSREEIDHCLARLFEFAKDDAKIQWFLIELYIQQKTLPSRYSCQQDRMQTFLMLTDYVKKEKSNVQAYSYLVKLLCEMSDSEIVEHFVGVQNLLPLLHQAKDIYIDNNDLLNVALRCIKIHHYPEALNFLSLCKDCPRVCWLRARCYLLDESKGDERFEQMQVELRKALVINDESGITDTDLFSDYEPIIKKLKEIASPLAISLLARLVFLAKKGSIDDCDNFIERLHKAAETESCAQTLLAYFYRAGLCVPESWKTSIDLLLKAIHDDKTPREIGIEAYTQLRHFVSNFFQLDISMRQDEFKCIVQVVYELIPYMLAVNCNDALKYFEVAEEKILKHFEYDPQALAFRITSGAYSALLAASKDNPTMLLVVLSTSFERYREGLERKKNIWRIAPMIDGHLGSDQQLAHAEDELCAIIEIINLFLANKENVARCSKVPKEREVVDHLYSVIGESLRLMEKPVETIAVWYEKACTFNPKNSVAIRKLFEVLCFNCACAQLAHEGVEILERCADNNVDAALAVGKVYSPKFRCGALDQFIQKDIEKSLKAFVHAAKCGSLEAESFLSQADTLPLDIEPLSIAGNNQLKQAEAVKWYNQALILWKRDNRVNDGLAIMRSLVKEYKMPAAALTAALMYHQTYGGASVEAVFQMLKEAIVMTHGLFPQRCASSFDKLVQALAESPELASRVKAGQLYQLMANARKNYVEKRVR